MVGAGERDFLPALDGFQELVVDGSAGKPDGAVDDHDVFLAGVEVSLFERGARVALVGGHEPRRHLHPGRPHFQELADIGAGVNAAGRNDGNGFAVFFFKGFHGRQHLGHQFFQGVLRCKDLLRFQPQMAAGHGALHHEGIGQVGMPLPFLAKHLGRPAR